MLRSYLRLAVRTLRRRKAFTLVNALGLTVGLACCALVSVFLQHELTVDTHHAGADRIYRLLSDFRSSTYSTISFERYWDSSPAEQRELATRLPEAVPAIEQATNFEILGGPIYIRTEDDRAFTSDRYLVTNTGPAFMDVFTFERVAGAPLGQALAAPYSAVLTESAAARYFGATSPIGQTMRVDTLAVTVQSVIADPPSNSRITFDLALQVNTIPNWGAYHYVRLAAGADPEAVTAQITQVMNEVDPRRVQNEFQRQNRNGEHLQALTDIHLASRALYDDTPHRNPAYLWAFGVIGLLILMITTINYANLALALYAGRRAEIGVRKALGGVQGQIAGQFLAEAALLALACVPLALGLGAALVPGFNALMGTGITTIALLQPAVLLALVVLALLAGLAAGGYPATVLSRQNAVDLFDRALASGQGGRGWSLRHGLIALQFVVLIGLGSLSWIAYDQLRYMQAGDLGYQTEGVVRLANMEADSTAYQQLRRRLLASSSVRAVGAGVTPNPGTNRATFQAVGSDVVHRDVYSEVVDVGWFAAMGIAHPVVEAMREAGPSAPERVLINQAAMERFGFESAAGRELILGPNYDEPIPLTVDGVLPNMHFRPMRAPIQPTVFRVRPERTYAYGPVVRFAPDRMGDGMQHVRAVWNELRPNTPLQAIFLDEQVASLYEQEQRFGALSAVLAVIAILLAALGLASLVAYLTRLRMKEIGVRKALGGSVAGIVALLNREYVQLVGVAFLVGAPGAWLVADWWLGQFAYRVDLSLLVFLGTGLGALAVAVAAVSVQALRVARVSPADVLRSE